MVIAYIENRNYQYNDLKKERKGKREQIVRKRQFFDRCIKAMLFMYLLW